MNLRYGIFISALFLTSNACFAADEELETLITDALTTGDNSKLAPSYSHCVITFKEKSNKGQTFIDKNLPMLAGFGITVVSASRITQDNVIPSLQTIADTYPDRVPQTLTNSDAKVTPETLSSTWPNVTDILDDGYLLAVIINSGNDVGPIYFGITETSKGGRITLCDDR